MAVKAAGLIETLESKGPFTVFAPTNEAFAKLPAGNLETLVKPENKAMMTKILINRHGADALAQSRPGTLSRDGGWRKGGGSGDTHDLCAPFRRPSLSTRLRTGHEVDHGTAGGDGGASQQRA